METIVTSEVNSNKNITNWIIVKILQEKCKDQVISSNLAKQQYYKEELQTHWFWVGNMLRRQILHFRNCCNRKGEELYWLNNIIHWSLLRMTFGRSWKTMSLRTTNAMHWLSAELERYCFNPCLSGETPWGHSDNQVGQLQQKWLFEKNCTHSNDRYLFSLLFGHIFVSHNNSAI